METFHNCIIFMYLIILMETLIKWNLNLTISQNKSFRIFQRTFDEKTNLNIYYVSALSI